MYIVICFIAAYFQEMVVSAHWRWQDNNAETCRTYVKYFAHRL